MRTRPAVRLAAVLVPLAVGAVALADDPPAPSPGRKILHEPMPGPKTKSNGPVLGDTPREGKNPTAFSAGEKVLPEPPISDDPAAGEPIFGEKGIATDRRTEDSPDRNTKADSTLHYVAVFNPDVVPFKRLSVLDSVADDYTMRVLQPDAREEQPVGGKTTRDRDRFWGDLHVRLEGTEDVAIPSVAPDMRILSYEVDPPRHLVFSKDGADNFYVRTDEPGASGVFHLVFFADADAGYFAPSLPSDQHYTPAIVRKLAPPEVFHPVSDGIARAAKRTLDEIGIDDRTELSVAFNKLVEFFRAFEAKPLPTNGSGDIYRDLCDHQAGVCRHRSFAFMVTANALGIPTRYVTNEAHAFVEVWFPGRNWQRIDLGGAALRLEVSNAKDKTLHRPRADDPFAKPKEYSNGYTQLEGDITGLSSQQLRDKHTPTGDAMASGDFADPSMTDDDPDTDPGSIGPDPSLPVRQADPKKLTPRIALFSASGVGYRGESMHVEGKVEAGGAPLGDHLIEVFLAPAGQGGEHSLRIGRGTTEADGTYALDVDLPGKLELRNYEVFVSTREDARYNAAISE
jgi:transglutaminase-like putative cysteine protease